MKRKTKTERVTSKARDCPAPAPKRRKKQMKKEAVPSYQDRAYDACCTDDVDSLKALLEAQRISPRAEGSPFALESLLAHAAAAHDSVGCLKAFVRHGWRIDEAAVYTAGLPRFDYVRGREPHRTTWTPLREAVRHSHLASVNFLLEQGADVRGHVFDDLYAGAGPRPNQLTPDREGILELLMEGLERNPHQYSYCRDVWIEAVNTNRSRLITRFQKHLEEFHRDESCLERAAVLSSPDDTEFDRLLTGADHKSLFEALKTCTVTGRVSRAHKVFALMDSLNLLDLGDVTTSQMLIHAVHANCTELIDTLCDRGVDVNMQSYGGLQAIHYACISNRVEPAMLAVLIGRGVNLEYCCSLYNDVPLYEYAPGIEISSFADFYNGGGWTPLHMVVLSGAPPHVLVRKAQILLDAGADVNALDAKWKTPLGVLRELLLESGAGSDDVPAEFEAFTKLLLDAGGTWRNERPAPLDFW